VLDDEELFVNIDEATLRRLETIEQRMSAAEKDLAAFGSETHSNNMDLSRRIDATKTDLEGDLARIHTDVKERITSVNDHANANHQAMTAIIATLNENVTNFSASLQQIHIEQNTNGVKIKSNEKILWSVAGTVGTVGLYFLQAFLKGGTT